MRVEVKNWSIKKNDHLWLENSKSGDYKYNDICDGCHSKMKEIARVTNFNSKLGLVTGLCPNCGYVKRINNLPEEWYAEHFAKRWLKGKNSDISDQQILKEDNYVYNKLSKYLSNNSKSSVLDAGCGIGQRLLPFSKNGFKVFGFDPSEHRTKIASDIMENIEVNSAENYFRNNNEIFDAIYFFNVLQFVQDPFFVIREASKKLSDGGILFFSVGQFYNDGNYVQFSHFGVIRSFLTLYSLKSLFEELDLWPIEFSESPFEIVLRKGKKSSNSQKIFQNAEKICEKDFEKIIRKSLNFTRLNFLGKSTIKYQGREIVLKKHGKFKSILPVEFLYEGSETPILLK